MKFNKIFTFALAALAMTACSDDTKTNPADVTVEFAESTIEVLESSIQLNVPVVVKGDNEGDIQLDVEITEVAPNPAVADHHFKLTSDHLNIPAGVKQVNLEFLLRDDAQINEDRTFMITITSVDNAGIGTKNTCTVTLLDNDSNPYNGLQGAWKLVYNAPLDVPGLQLSPLVSTLDVVIEGVPQGQLGHGRRLFVTFDETTPLSNGSGWNRQERVRLDYDDANQYVAIELGQVTCAYKINPSFTLTFSDGSETPPIDAMQDVLIFTGTLSGSDKASEFDPGTVEYHWDEDYTVMKLDPVGLVEDSPFMFSIMMQTNAGLGITYCQDWGNMYFQR